MTRMGKTGRVLRCIAITVAAISLAGCRSRQAIQGEGGVVATYKLPTLSADLPDEARVPAVIAAAEQTVRARGYSVARSGATEERGELVCRPPRISDYPTIQVRATRVAVGTRVAVRCEPFGDEHLSRSLLDGILVRLGL